MVVTKSARFPSKDLSASMIWVLLDLIFHVEAAADAELVRLG